MAITITSERGMCMITEDECSVCRDARKTSIQIRWCIIYGINDVIDFCMSLNKEQQKIQTRECYKTYKLRIAMAIFSI